MASTTSSLPVDLSSVAPREPSICIPRVFANITEARVRAIVTRLDLGEIERIDMVQRENDRGEKFQRVFIHFVEWYDTAEDGSPNLEAIEVRQRLLKGIEVKVVYDDPWFWKMSASKVARPEERKARPQRPKPFLDLAHTARAPELRKGGNQSRNSRGNQPKGQGRRARKAQQRSNSPQVQRQDARSVTPPKRKAAPPPLKLVETAVASEPKTPPLDLHSPAYSPHTPPGEPAAN